ncbi:MAG: MMPL family transporter, partial [Bacteroidota bacterium]
EIDAFERRLSEFSAVSNIYSPTATYKNIHLLFHQNRPEEYVFPKEEKRFKKYKRFAKRIPSTSTDAMISEDRTKARISSRIQDIGADEVKAIGLIMDDWIKENIDPQIATIKRTGTGLMLDKSSEYIRESLIWGLGLAILMVSVLMMLLFRNVKLLVVCLLPNMIPLLLAGALLGYSGTEMEMGIPIVFAVIFGIVVDDTIHFLGKFKLLTAKGLSTEEALQLTFRETGKALCLTTIILFFGFMVLLFSKHPPTFTAGWLVSLTLLSALFCDLLLIPPLLRWLVSDELPEAHQRFDNAIEHA